MSTAAKPSARRRFDSPEQEAFLNLWRTYEALKAFEETLFAAEGLTSQQYNALRLLKSAHPGHVPTLVLAGRLISRAPDITRLLDRLEQRGLVERLRAAENRRVVQVRISPAGLELIGKLADRVRDCHERQLGHLTRAQLKQLTELLRAARGPHEVQDDWR
jgi:DNA-binding MarR family transcriptional regulator